MSNADVALLNRSLSGEYFGIAAYTAALGSGLLQAPVAEVATAFRADHEAHAARLVDLIRSLGGEPIQALSVDDIADELPPLASQEDVLRYAASLEQSAASGHLSTIAQFEDRQLAQVAGSILGDEAMHWSVLLSTLGEDAVPVSFIPLPDPT